MLMKEEANVMQAAPVIKSNNANFSDITEEISESSEQPSPSFEQIESNTPLPSEDVIIPIAAIEQGSSWEVCRLLCGHACSHAKASLLFSVLTTLLHSGMEILWPFLLSTAIDENTKGESHHHTHGSSRADTFTLLFAAAWTLGQLAYYARSNATMRLTADITQASSKKVINHIMQLSYPDWEKKDLNVATMSEYRNNIDKIVQLFFVTLPSLAEIGIDAALVSWYCGTWQYAVSIPVGTATIALLTVVLSHFLVKEKVEEATNKNFKANNEIEAILKSFPLNKLHGISVEDKMNQLLREAKHSYIKASTWGDSVLAFQSLLTGLGIAALLLYTSYLIQESDVSDENRFVADDIVYVTNYLIAIAMNLYTLGNHSKETRVALANLENSFAILQTHIENTTSGVPFPLHENGMTIECHQVTIKNPKGFAFLRNISFTLKPGQLTGLVGPSGSGKSNITRLLLGVFCSSGYNYTGSITYNDIELRDISLHGYAVD